MTALKATPDLVMTLRQICGNDHVRTDEATRRLFSEDIYSRSEHLALAIAAPGSAEELAGIVAAATRAGQPVVPRGAGMSYSGGYLSSKAEPILIDSSRLTRVLEVNEQDMYVRVEAGCSWAALRAALKPKGLRTPFWGPLSGLTSTIGGGLSQGNAFFGAGQYGTSGESVLALKIVLADGTILSTGTAGTKGAKPFFRQYGPDLTGLFLGDTGALGIKAEAVLRLMREPAAEGYLSFAFDTRGQAAAAMSELARAGIGAEVFGFDPKLQAVRMRRASLLSDVKSLAGVVTGAKSLLAGVKEAARVVTAGRSFMEDVEYSVHVIIEGRSEAAVAADLAEARKIASAAKGREIENTIPKVVRGTPFAPLNNMIGPEGQRWAPIHGILAHSDALACWEAIEAYFESEAGAFDAHGVTTGYLITTLSTNAFLLEPVFYWPEELFSLHEASVEPSFLAKMPRHGRNPAASEIVARARRRVAEIFLSFGAAHFQIGRTYPYKEGREAAPLALLEAIKRAVDPKGLVNPGALGL